MSLSIRYFLQSIDRVGPQESGGRAFRNQTYIMISVAGDAVLVDYGNSDNNHDITSTQQDQEWERVDVARERG